jgi:feruloyl esterase
VLKRAVLAACDELDAVKDGLIQDPRECRFDPATLQCEGAEGAECLTPAQVETVRATYGGLKDPTSGRSFWPGYEPGTELAWAFRLGRAGGPPNAYFKYFAMADQNWDWRTFDMSDPKNMQLMYDAEARLGAILNSTDPDLGSFEGAGGKLILYHGWSDQNISPRNSVAYYESVAAFQGGDQAAQGFVRLFMAPGMGHCGGGDGPNTFDALSALESWVEKGEAPVSIPATHAGPDGKGDRSRPLCVYPQVETYEGSGDINDAASFRCALPR